MKLLSVLCLLATLAYAQYSPRPYTVPEAEVKLRADLAAQSLTEHGQAEVVAKLALKNYPDDVSIGRIAQDALIPFLADPVAHFLNRANSLNNAAAKYLYARAANNAALSDSIADELLAADARDYWALRLKGSALATMSPDSLPRAVEYLERAIAARPDRPDTYLYAGFYYKLIKDDERAIKAFEAGAVCDPTDKIIHDFRLTHYATHKMPDEYFALVPQALPTAPLDLDVTLAKDGSKLSKDVFRGHYSILECWTYL